MGAYRSANPLPPTPPPVRHRRRSKRPKATSGSRQHRFLWLAIALVLALYAHQADEQPAARPELAHAPEGALAAEMASVLPPGAVLTQSVPLSNGVVALAWRSGESAWTGAALPRPEGGYRLWIAVTPGQGDVAERTQVSLIHLPGLADEVLVSQYTTDGCCSWINLFALSETPRVLFTSPTSYSRMGGGRILVKRPLVGEYPDGPAMDLDTYTWDGTQFTLSSTALAPQHYFPLAEGLRWTYRTPDGSLERWVQGSLSGGKTTEYLVRSALRKGDLLSPVPDSVFVYAADGSVWQRQPKSAQVLPPTPGVGSAWQVTELEAAEVVQVKPQVKVPAGLFSDVLVVERAGVRQFFAPHVGLIREERDGKPTLELTEVMRP